MTLLDSGSKAPAFTLTADHGKSVSLSDFAGRNVVLYFYPKDSTPGCTREAEAFRDLKDDFAKAGTTVLGVSRDSVKSHESFRDKYTLNFPLLSDPERSAIEAYGVWQEKKLYGKVSMGIVRTTFVIDGTGTIRNVWRGVKVDGHADKVLAAVRALG